MPEWIEWRKATVVVGEDDYLLGVREADQDLEETVDLRRILGLNGVVEDQNLKGLAGEVARGMKIARDSACNSP